jgi:hypothetical protein
LPEATRRFLRPLVGIDPADARIHRGAHAEQVTSDQSADAVTVGTDIFLAPGYDDESPEALGVLAHELTHVARQHTPRFIPPLVEQRHSQSDDEEALARTVEAHVADISRATQKQADQPILAGTPAQPDDTNDSIEPLSPPTPSSSLPTERSFWGELPAPWEALPTWMTSASTSRAEPAMGSNPSSVSSGGTVAAQSAAAPAVQHAETGRSIETVVDAGASAEEHAGGMAEEEGAEGAEEAEEPDLDQLAQQVYAILKRRLAAERRRNSMFGL